MRNLSTALKLLISTTFILAISSLAQAQAIRTWVSGVGDDVNPCSRTAPCKTFAGALPKTAAGGEIDALDPGGFGSATITKSITIDGQGTLASILHSSTNGVNINDSATATPGTIVVILRNLSLNGAGTTLGINGINFTSGKTVNVENCRIERVSGSGININTGALTVEVNVEDTTVSNATGSGLSTAGSAGGVINVSVNNSVFKDNGNGVSAAFGTVNITNSVVTGNATHGIQTTSGNAVINAGKNVVTDNGSNGISAALGSTVRISENSVFRNGTGLNNAGTMETLRNNKVRGNGTNLTGALTDISAVNTGTF
jgi:hypothetical protein